MPSDRNRTYLNLYSLSQRILNRLKEEIAVGRLRIKHTFWPYPPLTIATGANSPYFVPLKRLLRSLLRHERPAFRSRVIVFDLGLEEGQVLEIAESFPSVAVRKFHFDEDIPWCDITKNAGFYAWKPLIIDHVIRSCATDVLWLDASIIVRQPLLRIRRELQSRGFYAPFWSGFRIHDMSHPETLNFMDASAERNHTMVVAAVVGLSITSEKALEMLAEWTRFARIEECISPQGATLQSHKGDQSLLSVLAYRYNLIEEPAPPVDCNWLDFFIENCRATMFVE